MYGKQLVERGNVSLRFTNSVVFGERLLPEVWRFDLASRRLAYVAAIVRLAGGTWTMCDEATTEAMRDAGAAIVVRKEAGLAALVQALLQVALAMGRTQAEPGTESA